MRLVGRRAISAGAASLMPLRLRRRCVCSTRSPPSLERLFWPAASWPCRLCRPPHSTTTTVSPSNRRLRRPAPRRKPAIKAARPRHAAAPPAATPPRRGRPASTLASRRSPPLAWMRRASVRPRFSRASPDPAPPIRMRLIWLTRGPCRAEHVPNLSLVAAGLMSTDSPPRMVISLPTL